MNTKAINRRSLLGVTVALGSTILAAPGLRAQERSAFQPSRATSSGLPQRTEFVIRNGYVLTMDPAVGELPIGDVHVRNGQIVSVGTNLSAPGAQVIEGRGTIVMPGFVDTLAPLELQLSRLGSQ